MTNFLSDNPFLNDRTEPMGFSLSGGSIIQAAWSRRYLVLLVIMVVAGTVGLRLWLEQPHYLTTSRLYVERTGPKFLTEEKGLMTQSRNYLFTQAELIKSIPILTEVLQRNDIANLPLIKQSDNPLGILKNNTIVNVGRKDDIISVSFSGADPAQAAEITNAVVLAYIDYHEKRKKSTALEVLRVLQNEKQRVNHVLSDKYDELVTFARENGTLTFESESNNVIVQRLARLNDALTQTQLEKVETMALYEVINASADNPEKIKQLAAKYDRELYLAHLEQEKRLRNQLAELQVELEQLQQQATANHPAVKSVQLKISRLQMEISGLENEFASSYRESVVQQWVSRMQKEMELQQQFDAQREKALNLNAKAAEYSVLQAEIRRSEKLCDDLDNRIKELNVSEDTGALNIMVLETARSKNAPLQGNRAKMIVLAVAVGLFLGIAGAVVLEYRDHRLKHNQEIAALLNTEVLGNIPSMPKQESYRRKGMKVQLEPVSEVAEAYRALRASLHFRLNGSGGHVLMVTSPQPGDGKSTLVSNLSLAFASAKQRTLVIDADWRQPMQHKIFGLKPSHGLAQVLNKNSVWSDAVLSTNTAYLSLLPCAGSVSQLFDVTAEACFRELLQQARQHYDYVLVDAPPVLPVADTRLLAAIADDVLLVLKAHKTTREVAWQARLALENVQASLCGAVMNNVKVKDSHYGYIYPQMGTYPKAQAESEPLTSVAAAETNSTSSTSSAKRPIIID